MKHSVIKELLELAGGPAFALRAGVVRFADAKAAALGLNPGTALSELMPGAPLPQPGGEAVEAQVVLSGRCWSLRALAASGMILCFLRPPRTMAPAPNESTLVHTAGSIRLSLQDLVLALDGLADTVCEDPAAAQQTALALRSVYRLRRTAGDLELLASLCAGTFRLSRQACRPVAAAAELCAELAELLRFAGCALRWELPQREIPCCLDWPLTAALLRELIANAAADAADGKIHLSLTQVGKNRLCFAVRNTPAGGLPEAPFHRHSAEQSDLRGGAGLGLSLVSAGAECHGGGLLLSGGEDGSVTALLTLNTAEQADETIRSLVQLPLDPEASLTALSPVLPAECYRPEDLL
jgi:hypothetical protein